MNLKMLKIAISNVMKQKRRTFFNTLTFAVNMIAIIYLIGILRGTYNAMIDNTIDLYVGHMKIYNKNYIAEKKRFPLDLNIADPQSVIKDITSAPGFVEASARIVKDGVISNYNDKTNIIIYGINFDREKRILATYNKIDGTGLSNGRPDILLGKNLAGLLGAGVGAPLLLYGQTRYNANNLVDVKLSGIYSAGFDFLERNVVYIDYDFAQKFLDLRGKATEIIIRLKSRYDTGAAKAYIQDVLAKKYPDLTARDWMQEAPELISGVKMDIISYSIIFIILLFLAIFIIVNTLTISVFERVAEIGTLRAIGFEKTQVRQLFFTEGILLALAGVFIGGILSLPLAYYMNVHGIPIPVGMNVMSNISIPFPPVIKGNNTAVDWLIAGIICLIAGAIGAIVPAATAARVKIVDALKKGVR